MDQAIAYLDALAVRQPQMDALLPAALVAARQHVAVWDLRQQASIRRSKAAWDAQAPARLAVDAQRVAAEVLDALQRGHETFAAFLEPPTGTATRWQRVVLLFTAINMMLCMNIWMYQQRSTACCALARAVLGCSAVPSEPCRGYSGDCGDLPAQFADVPGSGLEDWACPAFPDPAVPLDHLIVSLIMMAVAIPSKLILQRAFAAAARPHGAPRAWLRAVVPVHWEWRGGCAAGAPRRWRRLLAMYSADLDVLAVHSVKLALEAPFLSLLAALRGHRAPERASRSSTVGGRSSAGSSGARSSAGSGSARISAAGGARSSSAAVGARSSVGGVGASSTTGGVGARSSTGGGGARISAGGGGTHSSTGGGGARRSTSGAAAVDLPAQPSARRRRLSADSARESVPALAAKDVPLSFVPAAGEAAEPSADAYPPHRARASARVSWGPSGAGLSRLANARTSWASGSSEPEEEGPGRSLRALIQQGGMGCVYCVWFIAAWFTLTYGEIIYQQLGDSAESHFAKDWATGVAIENAAQWRTVLQSAVQNALVLLVIERIDALVVPSAWLELHLDHMSLQATVLSGRAQSWRVRLAQHLNGRSRLEMK